MQNEECKMQKENPNLISWDGESVMSKEFALATVKEIRCFMRNAYHKKFQPADEFDLPLFWGKEDFNCRMETIKGLEEYIENSLLG